VTNEQEYTSLPMLIRDMAEAGDNQWADEYDDALKGGATGGEIQARLGNFFNELQQSEIAQRPEFRQRIRDMIAARSPHRSEVENVIIPVNDPDIVRVKALALAKTLRDADERDWTEGIEYALGHGGLGNILGELYSADAGRRLALQPILLDLYRYNLELPHSSPTTLPLTNTDQFYQRVGQLITDLEMLGETLACSDLRRALYGLTGGEIVANIGVQLPGLSMSLRPPISEHIRVILAYLAANTGTRRKRANISLPSEFAPSLYSTRLFATYRAIALFAQTFKASGDGHWGEELERALYAPLEFGNTTARMSNANFVFYYVLSDVNVDTSMRTTRIEAIHRAITWISLANGQALFTWNVEQRESGATRELREAFDAFLTALRAAGEAAEAKAYQYLLQSVGSSSTQPTTNENWAAIYMALWSFQRRNISRRLRLTNEVRALIENIGVLLTNAAPFTL